MKLFSDKFQKNRGSVIGNNNRSQGLSIIMSVLGGGSTHPPSPGWGSTSCLLHNAQHKTITSHTEIIIIVIETKIIFIIIIQTKIIIIIKYYFVLSSSAGSNQATTACQNKRWPGYDLGPQDGPVPGHHPAWNTGSCGGILPRCAPPPRCSRASTRGQRHAVRQASQLYEALIPQPERIQIGRWVLWLRWIWI